MNKIITNLSLVADAAEYFDKSTGAGWKIRSCLTNAGVWAANAYLTAQKSRNVEAIYRTMTTLATIRAWLRDSTSSSFTLDLTPAAVRKTLGLERTLDTHVEACRLARQKCVACRSATRFKEFYDAALSNLDEQRKQREQRVEMIAELLSDQNFEVTPELQDYADGYQGMKLDNFVCDHELYDEQSVERQSDTLAECVGNACEAMHDVCSSALASAITDEKISRLQGYEKAILGMMKLVGVDTKKLATRRARLEELVEIEIGKITQSVADIDAQIAEQMQALPVKPTQDDYAETVSHSKRVRVPKAKLAAVA